MAFEETTSLPPALVEEHDALHAELRRATRLPGRIGELATTVAAVLHDHFEREEELAMPSLKVLAALAHDHLPANSQYIAQSADRLKTEMSRMLMEHREIVNALDRLIDAALAENTFEIAELAERMKHHVRMEEEVLYPAAMLVGQYLRLRLAQKQGMKE